MSVHFNYNRFNDRNNNNRNIYQNEKKKKDSAFSSTSSFPPYLWYSTIEWSHVYLPHLRVFYAFFFLAMYKFPLSPHHWKTIVFWGIQMRCLVGMRQVCSSMLYCDNLSFLSAAVQLFDIMLKKYITHLLDVA